MAAGLGFKDFVTGEVLTAADVDGYLMQGIWVFASAAARDAAVTSPQEGNACYLKDTNQVLTYSGSAWVAVGGGSPLTTKGDIYGFSTVDARIPIGANNTVLTADSTQALGLKWAAPASGGKILQVVFASTATETSSSSDVFADTTLTGTITPSLATSKILVFVNQNGIYKTGNNTHVMLRLLRGATTVANFERLAAYTGSSADNGIGSSSTSYLDEPATTSATTYKTQFNSKTNLATVYVQGAQGGISSLSTMILMEIGA